MRIHYKCFLFLQRHAKQRERDILILILVITRDRHWYHIKEWNSILISLIGIKLSLFGIIETRFFLNTLCVNCHLDNGRCRVFYIFLPHTLMFFSFPRFCGQGYPKTLLTSVEPTRQYGTRFSIATKPL